MTLPSFLMKHVDKIKTKFDKDTDLLFAYLQLLSLVVELTFSYFSLIFLALSLVSLHYFNKRVVGLPVALLCCSLSIFFLYTRSEFRIS
jgi:hypothetical protein